MSDALTKGSERLAQVMWKFDEWDRDNTISIIAADPGVKALVELAVGQTMFAHCFCSHLTDKCSFCRSTAALKLWEDGLEQPNLSSIEDSVAEHGDE